MKKKHKKEGRKEEGRERKKEQRKLLVFFLTHGPHKVHAFIREIDTVDTRDAFTRETAAFSEAKYMNPSSWSVEPHPFTGLSALPLPTSPLLLFYVTHGRL